MQLLYSVCWLFCLLIVITGQTVTNEPENYRTGRLNQFVGYVTPQPLPTNAQYLYSSVWAAWSAWSICVNNYRIRVRACNTVKGFRCLGKNMEQAPCTSTEAPAAEVQNTEYDVVDPWEEDRKEALKQLYPDYAEKQMMKPTKFINPRIPLQQFLNQFQYKTTAHPALVEGVVENVHNLVPNAVPHPQMPNLATSLNPSQMTTILEAGTPATAEVGPVSSNFPSPNHTPSNTIATTGFVSSGGIQPVAMSQEPSNAAASSIEMPFTGVSTDTLFNSVDHEAPTSIPIPETASTAVAPLAATEVVKFSSKNKELLIFNPVKSNSSVDLIPIMVTTVTTPPLSVTTSLNEINFTFISLTDDEDDFHDIHSTVVMDIDTSLDSSTTPASSTDLASETSTNSAPEIQLNVTAPAVETKSIQESENTRKQQNQSNSAQKQQKPVLQILKKTPKQNQQQTKPADSDITSFSMIHMFQNSEEINDIIERTTTVIPNMLTHRILKTDNVQSTLSTTEPSINLPPRAKAFRMEDYDILYETTTEASAMPTSTKSTQKPEDPDELIRRIRAKLRSQMKKKKAYSSQIVTKRVEEMKRKSEKVLTILPDSSKGNAIRPEESDVSNDKVTVMNTGIKMLSETNQRIKKMRSSVPSTMDFKPQNVKQFGQQEASNKAVRRKPEIKAASQAITNHSEETARANQQRQNDNIQTIRGNPSASLTEDRLKKTEYIKILPQPKYKKNETIHRPSPSNKAMDLSLVPLGINEILTTQRPLVTQTYSNYDFSDIAPGRTTVSLKDGVWSEWNEWGSCLCGKKIRTRNCNYQPFMTNGCPGNSYESKNCDNYSSCNFVPYR